ncbi:prophage tail fiber N-terminal domain-containing protein [Serratia marcescens]|uniref:phage tail fiber protein n=1 Tax=Serratia marcescens TaxID=615 RepID=UPI001BD65BA9|nr:prophage tail fiber N-terminal domain-containing protein [Serratia marcescens]
MTLISGVLKGPYGDSRSGVTITMRSMKTSSTVLNLAKSQSITDDTGRYSLNVEPGAYEVIVSVYGAQPERVGTIEVYTDSLPGTLNDFLRRPGESDITPEIVQTVDRLRADAAASATAAKTSEQNAANSVKAVTDAGFGTGPIHRADVYAQGNTSFLHRFNGTSANVPAAVLGSVLSMPMDGGPTCGYIAVSSGRAAWIGISNFSGKTVSWVSLWSSGNTTVDANGFIKKASPIARLSGAPEKMADDYLDGFTLSGCVAVNAEAAGVSAERVSVGVYKVTGALGFAEEGWNIEVPQDVNGNRLCFVSANTGKDGTIYVKVSKRRFDIDTAAIVAGDPMDIPEGRWIDLRLEMPVSEVEEAPEAGEETAALENGNVDPI